MYQWIPIPDLEEFDQLLGVIDADYDPEYVVRRLKDSISAAVKAVLIETDYVDKDYRSTYYHFYAKKGRGYRADCVRLHFFDELVSFDEATLNIFSPDSHPEHHYFGFMVLRPTLLATIGRSVFSPDIRKGAHGSVIQSKYKVHLLGHTLSIWGFPSMDQHVDIAVCAHVACWSILRHYSERYAQHKEYLLHDITMMAREFDPGGLIPSNGLAINEAERIFQAADTFPLVISKDVNAPTPFYRQMLSYLESGFPLFVGMEGEEHAVVAVGHAWRQTLLPSPSGQEHAWDQVESVVVIDDNQLPYYCISADTAGSLGATYSAEDFDWFIVPLPEKIHYSAEAVEEYVNVLATSLATMFTLPRPDELVVRYFVTTTAALRRYMRNNQSQFDISLVKTVMDLPMSQFVWVVEYASRTQWDNSTIAARAILDATASVHDPMPVWFTHDEQTAIFFDRSTPTSEPLVVPLARATAPLGRMEQNLRPIRIK